MKLDTTQIVSYAAAAGFSGDDLTTAVAIALAESSGNPRAYNPEAQTEAPAGKGSWGLWQIFLWKHPEFEGWDLMDPAANAQAAFQLYQNARGTFRDWATYPSGYLPFLPQAHAAVLAESQAGPIIDLPPGTANASIATYLPTSTNPDNLAGSSSSPPWGLALAAAGTVLFVKVFFDDLAAL